MANLITALRAYLPALILFGLLAPHLAKAVVHLCTCPFAALSQAGNVENERLYVRNRADSVASDGLCRSH